jgi:hypothetical protein
MSSQGNRVPGPPLPRNVVEASPSVTHNGGAFGRQHANENSSAVPQATQNAPSPFQTRSDSFSIIQQELARADRIRRRHRTTALPLTTNSIHLCEDKDLLRTVAPILPHLDQEEKMRIRSRNIQSPVPEPPRPLTPVATTTTIETSQPAVLPSAPTQAAPSLVNIAPKPAQNLQTGQSTISKEQSSFSVVTPSQPAPLAPALSFSATEPKASTKSRRQRSATKASKRGKTRRRADDDNIKADDSSSDESEMAPIATKTKSGRQVNRPSLYVPAPEPKPIAKLPTPETPNGTGPNGSAKKRKKVYRKNGKELNVTCARCQRGTSPGNNMIVFCDECNGAWHQFCHDPPIAKEVIDIKEAEWFCIECRPASLPTNEVIQKPLPALKLRITRKAAIPPMEASTDSRLGGERFSTDDRRGYLSSLSHAALVDLLVDISERNPTVPMFPYNLHDLQQSKFVMTATPVNNPSQPEPTSTTPAAITKLEEPPKEIAPGTPKKAKDSRRKRHRDDDSDDSGSEYEIEEHRLYPRGGNGFRLPPDEEDLDMLLDDPACSTFSYSLHGYARANLNGAIPIATVG